MTLMTILKTKNGAPPSPVPTEFTFLHNTIFNIIVFQIYKLDQQILGGLSIAFLSFR